MCSILSIIVSYSKKENNFPGVNLFKLKKNRQLNLNQTCQLNNLCVQYKSHRANINAINDFNLDYQGIINDNNLEYV